MAISQITRTENDILRDARENLVQNVGISADNETSTSLNMLKSMSNEVASMWDRMNMLLRNGFLSTAFGSYLDEIGVLLQEPRAGFKRSMDLGATNLKYYLDESYARDITDLLNRYLTLNDRNKLVTQGVIDSATNPTLINLPTAMLVSNQDSSITYTTMESITLTNNQPWDFTPLIATGTGSAFNVAPGALSKHNIVSVIPIFAKITNGIKVKNLYGIRNGGDLETDENYRFRLSNKVVSAVTGNSSSIRQAVLSVPGVVDMSMIPRTHGNGTFTLFPKSVDPILSDGLMLAVESSVQSVMAGGSIAYVEAPTYLAVAFNIELRFLPGADINALFANARLTVMDYINNLDLGGEIVINEIIQRVMSLDDKIMDMNIPQFGFGYYDRQTGAITSYTPLRLMNQVADYNQKWYTNSNMCSICQAGTR